LDPQNVGFLDPDPEKYADPRIWIKGATFQPNPNTLLSKHKLNMWIKNTTKVSAKKKLAKKEEKW